MKTELKAQDLRIGNWINRLGKPTFINAIQKGESIDYISTTLSGAITINQIEPIQLTEEILLKCGFEYRNECRGQGAILDLHNENWKKGMSVAFMKDGTLRVLNHPQFDYQYLHQLQNLYFSLTGEELTINL